MTKRSTAPCGLRHGSERSAASAFRSATSRSIWTVLATANETRSAVLLKQARNRQAIRAGRHVPRQGRGLPWRVLHNPEKDRVMLLKDPVEDSALEFGGGSLRAAPCLAGA